MSDLTTSLVYRLNELWQLVTAALTTSETVTLLDHTAEALFNLYE